MTKEEGNYINVLMGRLRVKSAPKKLSPEEEFTKRLLERNRRDLAKLSEAQLQAAICRAC